jgi:hypothetical protein
MIFKSLVMRECYFGILLVTKEGEDGTWWSQSLKMCSYASNATTCQSQHHF